MARPIEEDPSIVMNKWQHPPSFYCPISQQCMHDPVVLSDGHSYERRHIERWLQDHGTSPVSGLLLRQKDLFSNHALRNAIEEYFQQVFSAHRRTIRKTMGGPDRGEKSATSVSLVRAIDALMQCSLLMSADLSTECILRQIMQEATALIGAEAASVFLLDAVRQELYSTVNSTGSEIRIPITVGIAGSVARSGEPLVVPDAYADDRFDRNVDVKTGFRTRNILCVPLRDRRGGVMGVAQLINKTGRPGCGSSPSTREDSSFSADDRHFLMVFASQAAIAIANNEAFAALPSPRAAEKPAPPPRMHAAGADGLLKRAFAGWGFDAFALAKVTDNRPLSALGMYILERSGLVDDLGLDRQKLARFLEEIERGYDDANPYHNRAHAASVLQAMHALLEQGGLKGALAPVFRSEEGCGGQGGETLSGADLGKLACLLAAIVHDYEHPGLSNDFLVKTGHERAIRYNDRHVNEHHHAAAAFGVLLRPECNFLEHLPTQHFRQFRSLVIDLVLGTDMAQHGSILQAAGEALGGGSGAEAEAAPAAAFEPTTRQQAMVLLQLAMKCSDLGHLALDWEVHLPWVRRLEEEFFKQGDREKAAGLPVSFLMDRSKPGASATQVGFLDHVALPLFRMLARALPGAGPVLLAIEANRQRWSEREASAAASDTPASAAGAEAAERVRRRRISRRLLAGERPADAEEGEEGASGGELVVKKKRSGRARQRAAKFWASVRRATPSPSPGRPFL